MMTTERSLSHDTEEPHKSGDKTGGTADTTDMVIYCLVLPVIIVLLILLCKCFVRYLQRDISNESVQEHEPLLSPINLRTVQSISVNFCSRDAQSSRRLP